MTYRRSFLLTAEDPVTLDDLLVLDQTMEEKLKPPSAESSEVKKLRPPPQVTTSQTTNGATAINGETENGLSSVYFLKKEVERLKGVLKEDKRKNSVELSLKDISGKVDSVVQSSPLHSFKARKTFKEDSKIMSFDWSADNRHIVCGTSDGTAYVWDGFTSQKEVVIQTPCKYVLSCSYSPSTTMVGCCGLNCHCSLYSIDKKKSIVATPKKDVGYHNNYMTNCAFFGSDHQIITTGEDGGVALWDVDVDDPVRSFHGHTGIVNGLAINRKNPFSVFATCGNDNTIHIWDTREGDCVLRIDELGDEISQVRFFPTKESDSIGFTTSDGQACLFDLKANQLLQTFEKDSILFGASSLDFSASGRILFVGYDDSTIRAWDTLKGKQVMLWFDHNQRISDVMMSPDGMALGSSSWDGQLKVWA